MSLIRKIIQTNKAPRAVGVYSQAVLANGFLYISGQVAIDPETGNMVQDTFDNECRRVLNNLGAVLEAAGGSYDNVIKTTVLLSDISKFDALNNVYKQFFKGPHLPARACYAVAALPKGANVEIEAVALIGNIQDQ